ncbi:S46 family peptidase [Bacteroidales bacterium OttesenSCG-928-B11]|nr:S46 family peptidase [Bacteroidales bacterium OttesenSCG-928-B11]MDL2325908.1 S46 family peptidase [Bacteroidales bacterium OttesenSCG-928-A14]
MRKFLLLVVCISFFTFSRADEGMWIPLFLKYNEAEMQQMGFKLTAEDVYSMNNHSMKDAIVLFGRGCTGELISEEGLLITNHHCGYSMVQSLSTLENNYLHNGFWAKSKSEELACPGLTVTFLVRMEDVTEKVLEGTALNQSVTERDKLIEKNIARLTSEAVKGTHYQAVIKPFYYGNQYFMFVNETFKDVRLVGTPPESIGKFGGDSDNWMWPRHTGDFSLYRIYCGKDGKPANYSNDNVPYHPKQFFKISTKGVEENDFTLVFGYPGTTRQFLISDAVRQITDFQNPVAIHQRGVRLDIMKKYMDQSVETRLLYSGKANSISNGWKKWIGESKGLKESKAIDRKLREEEEFAKWVNSNADLRKKYGTVLSDLKDNYTALEPYLIRNSYFMETFPAIELVNFAYRNVLPFVYLAKNKTTTEEQWAAAQEKLVKSGESFYKSLYKSIDKEVFSSLLHYYFTTIDPVLIPEELKKFVGMPKPMFDDLAVRIYDNTIFSDAESFKTFVEKGNRKMFAKLEKSELFALLIPAYEQYHDNYGEMVKINKKIDLLYRTYVAALMEKDGENKRFYPDANLTMRVTYGQVRGFYPEDGKEYVYYTTLKGVMEKEDPNVYDYTVDTKLKTLYENGDYGRYANTSGEMPVTFIASNHTTGGNSGSPVLNANGELIGVNFDRVWEGTMSDINYDVSRCRNISLDIRYFLFVVDKFANAQNIIQELTIVE